MARKAFDPKKWARDKAQRLGGRPCSICANDKAAKACDDVGEIWASERPPGLSYRVIADMLEDEFGLKLCQGTVRNHFANHRRDLHRRISGP